MNDQSSVKLTVLGFTQKYDPGSGETLDWDVIGVTENGTEIIFDPYVEEQWSYYDRQSLIGKTVIISDYIVVPSNNKQCFVPSKMEVLNEANIY